MSNISIETLRKIKYENTKQLVEDLNRNFAVIQNSPLFKGIPGDKGKPGDDGLRGMRGSQIIFVSFDRFVETFPGETQLSSQIDLKYINSKLLNFETKNQLLKALNINEFVNNDIVVMTNSMMLSYDGIENIFVDTGIAFNEQSNIISSIEEKIEYYVKYYVDNNPVILGIQNIFEEYTTIAKNFSPSNNAFITRKNSKISGLFPEVSYDNGIGVELSNHKYFGFNTDKFTRSLMGTIVIGSIEKYYDLLANTLSTSAQQALNSSYIPNESNVPALVVLQNNKLNGIWFGYNGEGDPIDKQSTKRFASIYKNDQNDVVIKTDSGLNDEDFAQLLINRDYMKFWRHVYFYSDLDVTGDYNLGGNLNSPFIRTEKFTRSGKANEIEIGIIAEEGGGGKVVDSRERHASDFVEYENYPDNVFVADPSGEILKTYFVEKIKMEFNDLVENPGQDLKPITVIPSDDHKFVTSNYIKFLCDKINNIVQWTIDNVWRKNQFETGEIPGLKVSNNLECGVDLIVHNNIQSPHFTSNTKNDTVVVGKTSSSKTENSNTIVYPNFKGLVFVTDENGNLLKTYEIEKTVMNADDLKETAYADLKKITTIPSDDHKIVTSNYIEFLRNKINNIVQWTIDNVWRKNQFNTGDIPALWLKQTLKVEGDITSPYFNTNFASNLFTVGVTESTHVNPAKRIKYEQFKNCFLVTDSDGFLLSNYVLETSKFSNSELKAIAQISSMPNDNINNIPSAHHINWLAKKINEINRYINGVENSQGVIEGGMYWRKDQYDTGEIPSLKVSNFLKAGKSVYVGAENKPLFGADVENNKVQINDLGKTEFIVDTNIIVFEKFKNCVLVTSHDGHIYKIYELEELDSINTDCEKIPQSTKDTDYNTISPVSSEYKIPISTNLQNIWNAISNIKTRLKNTFNKPESIEEMYRHVEVGTIVEWTVASSQLFSQVHTNAGHNINDYAEPKNNANELLIPKGWVICDGRTIPGSNLSTPDLRNRFTRMTPDTTKAIPGGVPQTGGATSIKIPRNALPTHTHVASGTFKANGNASTGQSGGHTHTYSKPYHFGDTRRNGRATQTGISTGNVDGFGTHNHDFKIEATINAGDISINNSTGGDKAFDWQPQYFTVYKIMKYKSN